jgi:hypothetical protein
MAPAYWVYLFMAVTILFNGMKGYSRFRLWRIDATREKLATDIKQLVNPKASIHCGPGTVQQGERSRSEPITLNASGALRSTPGRPFSARSHS